MGTERLYTSAKLRLPLVPPTERLRVPLYLHLLLIHAPAPELPKHGYG